MVITFDVLFVSVVLLGAFVAFLAIAQGSLRWLVPPTFRRLQGWAAGAERVRVVVHTSDGQSISGLLDRVGKDGLLLAHAKYLDADGHPELAGQVWIPRDKVSFLQRPPVAVSGG